MMARIESFPDGWHFFGGKTIDYRQVGNAFPPLAAKAVGEVVIAATEGGGGIATSPQAVQLRLLETAKDGSAAPAPAPAGNINYPK